MIDLSSAIADFIEAKRAANRSERTLEWYADQLGVFAAGVNETDLELITTRKITRYMADQRRTGIGPGTLHARYRAVRAFLNWCVADPDLPLDHNPIDRVEAPKRSIKRPNYIGLAEYRRFVNGIDANTWLDARDALIAHLLFWSGFRAAELCDLELSDLVIRRRVALIRNGKADKTRPVPIAPDVPAALNTYLYSRPPWQGEKLFVSSDGYGGIRGVLSVPGLQQMLRRRCDACGIDRYLPHAWRHGFAMNMLEHGADLDWIGDVMGHEDKRVTRQYARWRETGITARFEEVYQRATRNT